MSLNLSKFLEILNGKKSIEECDENELSKLGTYYAKALYFDENMEDYDNKLIQLKGETILNKFKENSKTNKYFSIKTLLNDKNEELIFEIFEKTIIINDFDNISSKYPKDVNLNVASVLNEITRYCLVSNRNGDFMKSILIKSFRCPESISMKIGKRFDENRIELKLNYLILLETKKAKEEK